MTQFAGAASGDEITQRFQPLPEFTDEKPLLDELPIGELHKLLLSPKEVFRPKKLARLIGKKSSQLLHLQVESGDFRNPS